MRSRTSTLWVVAALAVSVAPLRAEEPAPAGPPAPVAVQVGETHAYNARLNLSWTVPTYRFDPLDVAYRWDARCVLKSAGRLYFEGRLMTVRVHYWDDSTDWTLGTMHLALKEKCDRIVEREIQPVFQQAAFQGVAAAVLPAHEKLLGVVLLRLQGRTIEWDIAADGTDKHFAGLTALVDWLPESLQARAEELLSVFLWHSVDLLLPCSEGTGRVAGPAGADGTVEQSWDARRNTPLKRLDYSFEGLLGRVWPEAARPVSEPAAVGAQPGTAGGGTTSQIVIPATTHKVKKFRNGKMGWETVTEPAQVRVVQTPGEPPVAPAQALLSEVSIWGREKAQLSPRNGPVRARQVLSQSRVQTGWGSLESRLEWTVEER